MVTDEQVRKLMKTRQNHALSQAAAKAGMDEKTARKYIQAGQLPSQLKKEHTWRTRPDPFQEVWEEIGEWLRENPGLEATTVFEYLLRLYPGKFQEGQLRTLQRRMKQWRALEGPEQEIFFPQTHHPGRLCQSDFTHLTPLRITIAGEPFSHLLYHFVLTYSNWETGSLCFSESWESLSEGLQNALWELGGVPESHQSDRLTAAVQAIGDQREFTAHYQALLRHYRMKGQAIQAGRANENGDVEQSHYRFKQALDQALMLRGHRDFSHRQEYEDFLRTLFRQRNRGRQERFQEELQSLQSLPARRLDDARKYRVKVGSSSTIHVLHNTYSVASRLIDEWVEVRVYAQELEVWYAQRCVDRLPRLRGEGKSRINYRHIIGWLVRKPGAFANYRYRSDLFPSSHFRLAYDWLQQEHPTRADREYLKILHLAAREGEERVETLLRSFPRPDRSLNAHTLEEMLTASPAPDSPLTLTISPVDLRTYDRLMDQEVRGWLQ